MAVLPVCVLCPISGLGYVPVLGYSFLVAIPWMALGVLHYNAKFLWLLVTSFEFLASVGLITISIAGFVDAVSHSPPRVIAFVGLGLIMVLMVSFDARIPTKNIKNIILGASGAACLLPWCLVIFWYCGLFLDIKQRIVFVGNISIDFQSVSISCANTLAVLTTNYFWLLWSTRSTETNSMLIAKPRAWYKLLPKKSEVLDFASPNRSDDVEDDGT